jgi:hypothetical protein
MALCERPRNGAGQAIPVNFGQFVMRHVANIFLARTPAIRLGTMA